MVAPLTGPFLAYPVEAFADNFRKRYKQAMPIDRPRPYQMYRIFGKAHTTSWTPSGGISTTTTKVTNFSGTSEPGYSRAKSAAHNLAYARLKDALGPGAGWAENIAQINKTRHSIIGRSMQLASVAVALKRGRFNEVARLLRTPVPSRVSHRKAVSQNFLEWEYGVKPLISDLQASTQILLSDCGLTAIRGRASQPYSSVTNSSGGGGSTNGWEVDQRASQVTMTLRAIAKINNPNVFLANQLGLIDLALPWKLMPFSFIVDWFVNVEQVISSVTDWYGVTLLHPHTTEFTKGSRSYRSFVNVTYSNGTTEGHSSTWSQSSVQMWRTLAISGPSLTVKPFKGFSLQRGAQALALVLSVLGK